MPRDHQAYLQDILTSIRRIEEYVGNLTFQEFQQSSMIQDAVVRNLEIIGEAVKQFSEEFRKTNSNLEWRKIGGLRDILIHAYFGIDLPIIWNILQTKLTPLKLGVQRIIETGRK